MDTRKLFKSCLADKTDVRISGTTIYQHVKSPFLVYCENFVPKEKKDPITDFHKLLLTQAKDHEEVVIQEAYPEMVPLEYVDLEDGFWKVLEGMTKGVRAIHGGPLFFLPEGLSGIPDILERDDSASSIFGRYHYIVKDVKLAKNIQDHHRLPTAYYNYLLGKIQKFTPNTYFVINRDGEALAYPYDEFKVRSILEEIRQILRGKPVEPTYGACDWPWETYCNEEAKKRNDASLVGGVGPVHKERLTAAGYRTVQDLSEALVADLTGIRGVGKLTANKFVTRARALTIGKPIQIGSVDFSIKGTEIFLDLEGTGQQLGDAQLVDIDYLIGVLVRKGGAVTYTPFLAQTLDSEEAMFRQFIKWLKKQRDFIIYHWHHYERTRLKGLIESYGVDAMTEKILFDDMRDLYKDATATFAFPTCGNRLKEVATCLGFRWRHEEVTALESIAYYLEYLQDPKKNKAKLQKVIDYNEDDCKATMFVRDWLVSNCTGSSNTG